MNILQLASILFVSLTALTACSDETTTAASYTPADCPPQVKPALAEPDASATRGGADVAEKPDEKEAAAEPDPRSDEREESSMKTAEATETTSTSRKTETDEDSPAFVVDLNTASATELMQLPGVGPALAERIIAYRERRLFKKVEDVKRVRGIGPSKFDKLAPHLSVE